MKKLTKNNDDSAQKYVNILGINVTSTPRSELLARVEDKISHNINFSIVTPGPEQVLRSNNFSDYKTALNSAAFTIPDGLGLIQSAKYLSMPLPDNKIARFIAGFFQGLWIGLSTFLNKKWLTSEIKPIKGRELFMDLLEMANKKKWTVFLLGGEHGEAKICEDKLKKKFKNIKIASFEGPILNEIGNPKSKNDEEKQRVAAERINKLEPELLFVAFGSGNPKQELWIHNNAPKLKVKCVMAVGGTLRYVAGLSKLPPKWMGENLEWLWRLFAEPHRIRRVFAAFPVFPLKVFWFKVTGK
jgi:N-acetylglucosaminyldiphosphoundecaprenol N-acetyl-beta-D-mannosaminyltransferase